ncbi:MAG: PD40 domain-containing protein [Caldilineaceae bacterium]|nr:PD40 domain-containing protein [Caldilineaceae bacterium]
MSRGPAVLLLVLATLLLSACQAAAPAGDDHPTANASAYLPVADIVSSLLADFTSTPADRQLAYIGADGNVYVTDLVNLPLAVTDDATAGPEGNGRSYHRLVWSPDHRLAFAAIERGLNRVEGAVFVAWPGETPQQVTPGLDSFVIYLHWSPATCDAAESCRLAYLIEEDAGIALRLLELSPQAGATPPVTSEMTVGVGRPFYFSWRPDGAVMLWHTGGATRVDPEAALRRYDLPTASTLTLPEATGGFQAPAWSADRVHWAAVVDGPAGPRVQIQGPDGAIPLADAPFDGTFAWSPDGTKLAYAVRARPTDPYFGPLHVYDLATGEVRRLTQPTFRVQAFFWSPDGRTIAYINWLNLPDAHWAQWRTYTLETDQDRGFAAFNPSYHMRMVIGSFNQYAQSHRVWSADSRYLVYANVDALAQEQVWIVDTHAPRGTKPRFIAEGALGVWSWE